MKEKTGEKKNKINIIFLAVIFFLSMPVILFSVDYYVDNVGVTPHFNTFALAYAACAGTGDTIHINKNITEDFQMTDGNHKSISITSDNGSTWDGAADTNPTFSDTAVNQTDTINIYNLTLDHSYSGGGYVFSVTGGNGANLILTNCVAKRTSTSTTNPAVFYWGSGANNGGTLTVKQSLVQGTANCYGFEMETQNRSNMAVLENDIITGFTGSSYAAVFDNNTNDANNITMTNCSVVGNYTGYKHGSTCSGGAGDVIKNTVFSQNTADITGYCGFATGQIQYCAFEQAASGFGTGCLYGVVAATEFVSPGSNWHIASTSVKLRNKGTTGTSIDYDGLSRPQESITDIGAYEYIPSLTITKSASVTWAYLGDTITYCLTYKNNSSSDMDTHIWDTVPANTLYLGCDGGCDLVGGTVVHWFRTVGSGYSGTVCFWVKVTGYPYFPMGKEYLACLRQREIEMFGKRNTTYAINRMNNIFAGL